MIDRSMKNRWIALYVENTVGVLAKVSGLFSGKSYNLQSLTVGTTEDETEPPTDPDENEGPDII